MLTSNLSGTPSKISGKAIVIACARWVRLPPWGLSGGEHSIRRLETTKNLRKWNMIFTMSGNVRLSSAQSRQNASVKSCVTIGASWRAVRRISALWILSAIRLYASVRVVVLRRNRMLLSQNVRDKSIAPVGLTTVISRSTAKAELPRDSMDAHTISGRGYRAMAMVR